MNIWKKYNYLLILLAISLWICFIGNNQLLITDPVESNYTLTAKEMLAAGDYISPRIFGNYWYDKPIFFYWELIAAFSMFGMTEFAARFFPALFGVAGIFLAYFFTGRIYDKKTAFVTALILITSLEYFYISKAVITDMTLFVTFSATLISFYLAYSEKKTYFYYIAYACAGISVLTKGPVGLVQPGLIILLFLIWRRDMKALLHMKLLTGLCLFTISTGLWYIPMYIMHDGNFVSQFIGVHNILRATVSEHPRYDVWYYYIIIFFMGFFPWVLTLPLAVQKYRIWDKLHQGRYICQRVCAPSALDMRQQFLISWVIVVFVFYQCVATKYVTYTFPYMIPIAIGFAVYLRDHKKIIQVIAGISIAGYTALTFLVAIPACRDASAWDAAQIVRAAADNTSCVVTYGGRYPVSLAYYSGYAAKRLKPAADIPEVLPGNISWNAKNVMPFLAIEEIPVSGSVIAVIHEKEKKVFLEEIPGQWQQIGKGGVWYIYRRTAGYDTIHL
ncbi:MAG: glycosyltransferase family 39 protein [Megasphaera cerevisiae]|jgi:4-amino-4-deoxy-L-arabinose transferase-like glycosyltransferase|nr:glycosyltransferase family 39 protein [Megasphaera cerevisiae]